MNDNEINHILFELTTSPLVKTKGQENHQQTSSFPSFWDTKTAKDLEWSNISSLISKHTRTIEGRELADCISPLPSKLLAEQRLKEVAEVLQLFEDGQVVPITGLKDLRPSLARVAIGAHLSASEMASISRNCDIASRIVRFFERTRELTPALSAIASTIDTCHNLRATLSHAIEPGGRISDYASGDLKNLRRAVQTQTERLRQKVDSLLQDSDLEDHLQDDYYTLREGRYVIPVRASSKTTVDGIIHGYSQSGQTAFIEPEVLIQLNNGLRWAQIAVEEEEERILARLSDLISESLHALQNNLLTIAYLDLIVAIAHSSKLFKGSPPQLVELDSDSTPHEPQSSRHLKIIGLRHPILHIKLSEGLSDDEENPNISNDLIVEPKRRVLVVSGPNTGGKTVLLKAFGLAVLMAKSGIPVPAEEAIIPFYGAVYTDIGDEQSIQKDLSTFSSHLVNIREFLPRCGPKSLVLLDELFTGTDPMQGAALAASLLEALAERHTTTLVTTHLESLKTIALQNDRFANASMGFDLNSLQPNYLLTLGVPGSSFALRIADRLGFPSSIVESARQKLDQDGQLGVDLAMAKLEAQAEELRAETNRLQHQRRRSEQVERKFRKKYDQLSKRDRELVNSRAKELQDELRAADQILRDKIRNLQVDRELQRHELDHIRETIRIQDQVIERVKAQTAKEVTRPDGLLPVDKNLLHEGMEVYALQFKRNAIIRLVDLPKNRVQIQIGMMKSFVDISEIFHTHKTAGDHKNYSSTSHSNRDQHEKSHELNDQAHTQVDVLMPQTSDNTVDLRGLRADEAVEKTDLFIDAANRAGIDGIYIIHGFGTGVLRTAIRKYLSQNQRVRKFRPGERHEGGDGVTIAYVKDWTA